MRQFYSDPLAAGLYALPHCFGGAGRKNPHGSDFPWGLQLYPVLRSPFGLGASHCVGIYRQRTVENVLKAQLVNFHRLTKS